MVCTTPSCRGETSQSFQLTQQRKQFSESCTIAKWLFIIRGMPTSVLSTLGGSAVDETTGAIGQEKLRTNIELVMEVYINQINNSPCGDTQIHSTEFQEQRPSLLIFLKGSQEKDEEMRKEKPALYQYFEKVWSETPSLCFTSTVLFFFLYAALVLIAHTPYARVENLHVKWNGLLVVHHSRQFQFLLQTLAGLGEI